MNRFTTAGAGRSLIELSRLAAGRLARALSRSINVDALAAVDYRRIRHEDGSEIACNALGLITGFKDIAGRSWSFKYSGEDVIQFTDPYRWTWLVYSGGWQCIHEDGSRLASTTLRRVEIDQVGMEIRMLTDWRTTTFRLDGSVSIEEKRCRQGSLTRFRITEYATSPVRAAVACEIKSDGSEVVIWLQDANGKVVSFDQPPGTADSPEAAGTPESGKSRAIATGAAAGNEEEACPPAPGLSGVMPPHMESVDALGNRYFITPGGIRFIVRPSGAAFSIL